MTLRSQPVQLDRSFWWESTDVYGRPVDPSNYRKNQLAHGPWCPICGDIPDDHEGPYPCSEENEVPTERISE